MYMIKTSQLPNKWSNTPHYKRQAQFIHIHTYRGNNKHVINNFIRLQPGQLVYKMFKIINN